MKRDNIRKVSFWNSMLPLTSIRVKKILSNPILSKRLIESIHNLRNGKGDGSFSIKY